MLDQSRDLQLIFQRYWNKASKGNRYAMMYVADCFLYGWGTKIDINQYKNCLNQAAILGVEKACERLFYEALSAQNFSEVERVLSIWGNRKPASIFDILTSYKKTIEIYNSLPQKDVQGMMAAFSKTQYPSDWDHIIAMCYQFGFGVEKNSGKATEIINHIGSQFDFADIIANVLGLYDIGEISKTQIGEHLFDVMCKLGASDAFESDENSNPYVGYIERLMIFAACAGHVESQTQMARLYLEGSGGLGLLSDNIRDNEYVNDIEALRWLLISLENGENGDEVLAPLCLLAEKLGENNDYENAFKAWYAVAQIGFIPAQRIVGSYYYNGYGVKKDYMQAGQWWLRAAQNGEEEAIKNVNIIAEIGNGDFWAGINVLIEEEVQENNISNTYSSNLSGEQTRSSGGCYVATCVYGSYDCPEVWTLRRFRDYHLARSWYGRLFIKIYYAISPTIVRIFGDYLVFKNFWRILLDKMVFRLKKKGYKSTKYNDKTWN